MRLDRYKAGFLILCFSAFLGHNLIPHYHHAEFFGGPFSTDCPVEHTGQSGHQRDQGTDQDVPPFHCHAFNDVTLDKFNASVHPPLTVQVKFLGDLDQTVDVIPAEDIRSLPDRIRPPGSIHLTRGTPVLRAPPSTV